MLLVGLFSHTALNAKPGSGPAGKGMDEYGLHTEQRAQFKTAMQDYFRKEKIEALFFVAVGVGALAFALWGLRGNDRLFQGMSYPLIAIALIQLVVGATVFLRTDAQLEELTILFYKSTPTFLKQELPRMEVVNKWFDIYRWIEIALIGLGALLVVFARPGGKRLLLGAGLGLILQSGLMLALDFVAEARADTYTEQIIKIKKVVDVNTHDHGGTQ